MTRRVMRGFSAQNFRQIRCDRGLSVSDLARLADVGQSTIHAWEAGKSTPQIDLLARAMAVLKAPIEQVVIVAREERYPGDWRVLRGITQPELAAAAKIATTTLRGIERADIALTDLNAATLAELLGIDVAEYRAAYQRARSRPPGTTA
ncbi:helix-turn-helix transcriptional regulator [Mycobacterium sp. IDR2000157661]|uniref:helix-turn-helix transcriptional regulator n=1 Tax=Mycobacterium sp. IDR2000157661 TaxID=2867005 RepID=UPI001EE9C33F|nr:helix-turn-helix transcriptional regulator [Mycobacterium sp. IDR2000157661]ULE31143.1 helix-turn-helix domain-containing protein [Mycobacterium sp. IDR2000157661]